MSDDREFLYQKLNKENFLQFYNSFESVYDLMKFTKSRKRADTRIFLIEAEKGSEISAVVPTKSIESNLVKILSKKLQGFNIIFVESGGPFFNFSYSMNVGIQEAIKINSKYIMLSNDDIFPLGGIEKLAEEVVDSSNEYDIFIPTILNGKEPMSSRQEIYAQSWLTEHIISNSLISCMNPSKISQSSRKLVRKLNIYNDSSVIKYIVLRHNEPALRKYQNTSGISAVERIAKKFNPFLIEINNVQPISIIKSDLLNSEKFDESYINGGEDTDLSLRLAMRGAKVHYLNDRFQNIGGYSLGQNTERILKNTIPEILIFGYKLNQYINQNNIFRHYR